MQISKERVFYGRGRRILIENAIGREFFCPWIWIGDPIYGHLDLPTCCGFFFLDSYGVLLYSFCLEKQVLINLFLFQRESKTLFRRDSVGAFIIGKNY
jgi:hypothetical protein